MAGIIIILGLILLFPAPIGIDEEKMSKRKTYCWIVFGAMFLFAALRGASVAIDNAHRYQFYMEAFQYGFTDSLRFLLQNSKGEVGHALVVWLISIIVPNPHIITMIFDGFILYTFGRFFYRYAEDLKIAALMYFGFSFSASLNITRQYIACAIFLWAIEYILKNKILKSVILIAVASIFHASAVVLFAIYFLYIFGFRITKWVLIVLSLGAVGIFFAFDQLSNFIVNRYLPQYSWYLRGTWAVGDQEFSVLWLTIYILLGFALFLCIKDVRHTEKDGTLLSQSLLNENEREKMFFIASVFYLVYALISMLTSEVWFFGRMKIFFCIGFYLTVGNIFIRFPYLRAREKVFLRLAFLIGMAVWTILMFRTDGNGLFPYVFFWE